MEQHDRTRTARRLALIAIFLMGMASYIVYSRQGYAPQAPVEMPTNPPENSLAVFNFRSQGGGDAKLLASGFARALGDRLLCAPTSLTLQPAGLDVQQEFRARKLDPRTPPDDDLARQIGKRLGVRWVVTGDLRRDGDRVDITVHVCQGTEVKTLTAFGGLSDLPKMQASLAQGIADAMHLRLSARQSAALQKPNFSRPEALILYGRSFAAEKPDEIEAFRWKAWEADPGALFPAIRLLEMYAYGPADYPEITSEKRLPLLIEKATANDPANSHIETLTGLLVLKQHQYRKAEKALKAVVRRDPGMYDAHQALASVAYYRKDADAAVREASAMVRLWPTSPDSHAMLSCAHHLSAKNVQQSRRAEDMWTSARRRWRRENASALREAEIALRLNPDCDSAWRSLLYTANDTGDRKQAEKAFRQLIRLEPEDWGAYLSYALSFSQFYDGDARRQRQVVAMVDKEFGPRSAEAYLLRAYIEYYSRDQAKRAGKMLGYVNRAARKTSEPDSETLALKCDILIGMQRTDEVLETAVYGFRRWPSPEWRLNLVKAYEFEWYRSKDDAILEKAADLLSVYVAEVPFDVRGRNELAWCLLRLGRMEEARKELFAVLKLDPGNQRAVKELERLAPKPPSGFPFYERRR